MTRDPHAPETPADPLGELSLKRIREHLQGETPEAEPKTVAARIRFWRKEYGTFTTLSGETLNEMDAAADALAERDKLNTIEHFCTGCHHRWEGDLKGAELCGDCWRKAQGVVQGSERHPAASLRVAFTNEVIRAAGALARQQQVCREQEGQVVFVTGMDAAREYLVEQALSALTAKSVGL
jgi:hypothetical protein